MLNKNNHLVTDKNELATVMNTVLVNKAESLDLKKDDNTSLSPLDFENINDILEKNISNNPVYTKLVKLLRLLNNYLFNSREEERK